MLEARQDRPAGNQPNVRAYLNDDLDANVHVKFEVGFVSLNLEYSIFKPLAVEAASIHSSSLFTLATRQSV